VLRGWRTALVIGRDRRRLASQGLRCRKWAALHHRCDRQAASAIEATFRNWASGVSCAADAYLGQKSAGCAARESFDKRLEWAQDGINDVRTAFWRRTVIRAAIAMLANHSYFCRSS
jgi:hypothetical protein